MKFSRQRGHVMDLLFTLGLFAIFAILCMLLVLIGANVYQSTAARMESNYTVRTSLAYITEKVHQSDAAGGVKLTEIEGVQALALTTEMGDHPYVTYIYFYDGAVCELFTKADRVPTCRQGTAILEAENLQIEETAPNIYRLAVTDQTGRVTETFVQPLSG